jgi:hypothetical protein
MSIPGRPIECLQALAAPHTTNVNQADTSNNTAIT